MLIDHHIDRYIEANILPQQKVRRLANGSIDYIFYDKRARTFRSTVLRDVGRAVLTRTRR